MTEVASHDDVSARNKEIALSIWGRDIGADQDPDGPEFRAHFDEHYTEDYWNHASEPGKDRGFENARAVRRAFQLLFTDAKFEIDLVGADGDLVFLQGEFSARHTGLTLYGLPATGTPVSQPQVHILRFRDGKISDHYVVRDDYVMYRQMTGEQQEGGILRFVADSEKSAAGATDAD
jgi:predicted ester cyclase